MDERRFLVANMLRHLPPMPRFPDSVIDALRQVDQLIADGRRDAAWKAMHFLFGAIYPQAGGPPGLDVAIYFADCLDALLPMPETPRLDPAERTAVVIRAGDTAQSRAATEALIGQGWDVVTHVLPSAPDVPSLDRISEDANRLRAARPQVAIAFTTLREATGAALLRARMAPNQIAVSDHEPCVFPGIDRIAITAFAPPPAWGQRLAGRDVAVDDWTALDTNADLVVAGLEPAVAA